MARTNLALDLTEAGYIPDVIIRRGIRLLLKQRLKEIYASDVQLASFEQADFISHMKSSPVALLPEKANEQHYEIPSSFYQYILGDFRKYSCCYWDETTTNLTQAEQLALAKTCAHAQLEDGQDILELGCGWGSLTLYMASNYPNSKITAVSNSNSQREYISAIAKQQNLGNVEVITCDMNDFDTQQQFDRVVSVEMMEHMRNYEELYKRIAGWLKAEGKLFKHIFVHRSTPYAFEVKDETDWMSEYFFSGGMMPTDDLPLWFQKDLVIENRWRWDGRHYEKTANAWLFNMDSNRAAIDPLLIEIYGEDQLEKWRNRWRMFFMACAELFGYSNGQEWFVSHYLFSKRKE